MDEFRSSGRFVDAENLAFHRLAESIAFTYKNVDEKFLICYSSSIDTFNSITMHSIQPIPNFLVLNTSSIEYYLFNDGTKKISQQAIVQWLDDVVTLKLEVRCLWFECNRTSLKVEWCTYPEDDYPWSLFIEFYNADSSTLNS